MINLHMHQILYNDGIDLVKKVDCTNQGNRLQCGNRKYEFWQIYKNKLWRQHCLQYIALYQGTYKNETIKS